MSILGVELSADRVRAVVVSGWRSAPGRTVEIPWDPSLPIDAVTRLKGEVGSVDRIAICVGLAFLHLSQVKLPPAPAADRRRMVALEPDRFFPVQEGELAVTLATESNFAFAVDADLIGRWVAAFESWAPVEAVDPVPLSLARALAGTPGNAVYALPAGPNELGWVEIHGGRFFSARRILRMAETDEGPPVPARAGVPGAWLSALGAARGIEGDPREMLLPESVARRLWGRRLRRVALLGGVCLASLMAALWTVDRWREAALQGIQEEIAVLRVAAGPAENLVDQLLLLDQERAALADLAGDHLDPLPVLAALGERLPPEAVVLSLRGREGEWQIEGTAPDAAAIVPLLDADARFREVRFLGASARYREGEQTYETFSIAFNVGPDA